MIFFYRVKIKLTNIIKNEFIKKKTKYFKLFKKFIKYINNNKNFFKLFSFIIT